MEEPDEVIEPNIFSDYFETQLREERTVKRLLNYDKRLYSDIIKIINLYNDKLIYAYNIWK